MLCSGYVMFRHVAPAPHLHLTTCLDFSKPHPMRCVALPKQVVDLTRTRSVRTRTQEQQPQFCGLATHPQGVVGELAGTGAPGHAYVAAAAIALVALAHRWAGWGECVGVVIRSLSAGKSVCLDRACQWLANVLVVTGDW